MKQVKLCTLILTIAISALSLKTTHCSNTIEKKSDNATITMQEIELEAKGFVDEMKKITINRIANLQKQIKKQKKLLRKLKPGTGVYETAKNILNKQNKQLNILYDLFAKHFMKTEEIKAEEKNIDKIVLDLTALLDQAKEIQKTLSD